MSKTVVLVLLPLQDEDSESFINAIEREPELCDRVELRFAKGEAVREAIPDAEVVVCGHLPPEMLDLATHLRWIAFWSAGVDGKVTPQIQSRELLVTNASGVHGPNIAEHVLAWMLMFARQMPYHLRAQIAGEWRRNGNTQRLGASELNGQTLGIVGLGRIGEALTVRAKAFGMRVIATKRNPQARYEAIIAPDALYAPDHLPQLLAESDHVCIALPYTPETHHLFNAEMFSHMKQNACLYNIARGKIVDEAALVSALQSGQIAGAGLDVFETEPLPAESPLWKMENVLITPHTAGLTPYYFTRFAALLAENLKRYFSAQPLNNLYDSERQY